MNLGRWLIAMADGFDLWPSTFDLCPINISTNHSSLQFCSLLLWGSWRGPSSSVKNFTFPLSRNRKTSSVFLPHPKDGVTLIPRWRASIYQLMLNNLSTLWIFRVFSSERKVAHIYAILMRSVLHIYTVGLYNYAFHLFLVTSPPVRVHTLYWP